MLNITQKLRCPRAKHLGLSVALVCLLFVDSGYAQEPNLTGSAPHQQAADSSTNANQIDVVPDADLKNDKSIQVTDKISDDPIRKRIQNILRTSDWFVNLQVSSNEGVVVLSGTTNKQEYRDWAGNVATRTEGVVAVINKISVTVAEQSSISPLVNESQLLWRKTLKALPLIGISLVLLTIFFMIAKYVASLSQQLTHGKIPSLMLRRLIGRAVAVPVMLIGIYLVLRITGLSKIATTVVGGTGLLGLVLGFAFRNIAENFLASILISIQRPFRLGETIQVLNYIGVVQAVTTRGTVIMTLDGNHVQIPNTIIYQEAIVNFSANPNLRLDFVVGIGYDASISDAQSIALKVLADHPAVLDSPEPWVLAEALAASTINLRIYFWVNNKSYNPLKVKSAIIRNIKFAFLSNNISMPDDAREVVFPQGIQVYQNQEMGSRTTISAPTTDKKDTAKKAGDDKTATLAEGNLDTDVHVIESQANQYSLDNAGINLLPAKNSTSDS